MAGQQIRKEIKGKSSMKSISIHHASLIFAGFTAYFFFLLFTLYPFLGETFDWNPVLNWFVTGYFLFMPIFFYAIIAARNEFHDTRQTLPESLSVRPMSATDWKYATGGLVSVFALTGVVFGASYLLTTYFGVRELSTTPWFIELSPLQGAERLLLLIWLPMFFFNIVGEELLWRGYIQRRLSVRHGWLYCAFLWLMFHLPFGIDLMIMLVPIAIVVPYVFHRTQSTLGCIFIHGVYNGPLFVAIALGAME